MTPLVLDYLKTHTLAQLEEEHGVCHRFSADGFKVGLNYDQIRVKPGDRLAEECRGMVLRLPSAMEGFPTRAMRDKFVAGDKLWPAARLVAWPLCRFYNYADPASAKVDWKDPGLRVFEKLDGTMIVLYWDGYAWCAGTRGVPEADQPLFEDHMEIGNATFAQLFWQAYEPYCAALDPGTTYVFELTGPWNRVVVEYPEPGITLLAARVIATGEELAIETLGLPFPLPRTWPLSDPDAVSAFVNASDPLALEGAVVVDSAFRRVKMKSAAWSALSGGKASVLASRRAALEAVLLHKLDDVLPLLDAKMAAKLTDMQTSFAAFCKSVDQHFGVYRTVTAGNRKNFALLVTDSGDWPAIYFQLLDGRGPDALALLEAQAEAGKLTDTALDSILRRIEARAA